MKRKAVFVLLCFSSIAVLSLSGCGGKDKEDKAESGEEPPYFASHTMESFFAAATPEGEAPEGEQQELPSGENEDLEQAENQEELSSLPLKGIKIALGEEITEENSEETSEGEGEDGEAEEEPPYFASNTASIFINTKAEMDAQAEAQAQAEAEAAAAAMAEIVEQSANLLQTEGSPLSQAEIDSLKAGASGNRLQSIEIYESVTQGGTYTDPNGSRITQVVGKPGDTSWRRMSDEEAQAIVNAGEPKRTDYPEDETGTVQYQQAKNQYQAALRESGAKAWNGAWLKDIYFYDYYKYVEYNHRMVAINLTMDRIASCVPLGAEDYLSSGEDYNRWKAEHPEAVEKAEQMWSRISSEQRERYNSLFLRGEFEGELTSGSDLDQYVWEYIQFFLERL
ncbi:MAG: hypothetical protein HFJ10_05200 [Lachnospiraceae bacterium]|nr:hypothetical protein [Lachnospiraceae bacterium]